MPNTATSCPAHVWELSISFLLLPPLSLPAPSHLSFSSFLSLLSSFLYQFIDTITKIEISVPFFQLFHILSKPLTGLLTTVFPPRGLGNGGFFSHERHQRTHLVQNIQMSIRGSQTQKHVDRPSIQVTSSAYRHICQRVFASKSDRHLTSDI